MTICKIGGLFRVTMQGITACPICGPNLVSRHTKKLKKTMYPFWDIFGQRSTNIASLGMRIDLIGKGIGYLHQGVQVAKTWYEGGIMYGLATCQLKKLKWNNYQYSVHSYIGTCVVISFDLNWLWQNLESNLYPSINHVAKLKVIAQVCP